MGKKLVGIGAAIGLIMGPVAATPAYAATTVEEITDVEIVHATPATFFAGTYTYWEPEGAAAFPSFVDNSAGSMHDALHGYRPVIPQLGAGCSAQILSFTYSIEMLQNLPSVRVESGFFSGMPATATTGSTGTLTGQGALQTSDGRIHVLTPVDSAIDATVTITRSEPLAVDGPAPFAWIWVPLPGRMTDPLWQVNAVSFQLATTCPDPATPTDTAPTPTPPGRIETAAG